MLRSRLNHDTSTSVIRLVPLFLLSLAGIDATSLPPRGNVAHSREKSCPNCLDLSDYAFSCYLKFTGVADGRGVTNGQPYISAAYPERSFYPIVDQTVTGIIASARDFDINVTALPRDKIPSTVFFPRDRILYKGFWVSKPYSFWRGAYTMDDYDYTTIYGEGKVFFVVTKEVKCPSYDMVKGDDTCPDSNDWVDPTRVLSIFGIGFGLPPDHLERSGILSMKDRHPLLQIYGVGDLNATYDSTEPRANAAPIRRGFIVNSKGMVIGLTPDNSKGTALQSIKESNGYLSLPSGCVSIEGYKGCIKSKILPDCRYAESYLYSNINLTKARIPMTEKYQTNSKTNATSLASSVRSNVTINRLGWFEYVTYPNASVYGPSATFPEPQRYSGTNIFTLARKWFMRFSYVVDVDGGWFGVMDTEKLVGVYERETNPLAEPDGFHICEHSG